MDDVGQVPEIALPCPHGILVDEESLLAEIKVAPVWIHVVGQEALSELYGSLRLLLANRGLAGEAVDDLADLNIVLALDPGDGIVDLSVAGKALELAVRNSLARRLVLVENPGFEVDLVGLARDHVVPALAAGVRIDDGKQPLDLFEDPGRGVERLLVAAVHPQQHCVLPRLLVLVFLRVDGGEAVEFCEHRFFAELVTKGVEASDNEGFLLDDRASAEDDSLVKLLETIGLLEAADGEDCLDVGNRYLLAGAFSQVPSPFKRSSLPVPSRPGLISRNRCPRGSRGKSKGQLDLCLSSLVPCLHQVVHCALLRPAKQPRQQDRSVEQVEVGNGFEVLGDALHR